MMERHEFIKVAGATFASSVLANLSLGRLVSASDQLDRMHQSVPKGPAQELVFLTYPDCIALDLIGPLTYLAALGNTQVHLVWKTRRARSP